jgi:predicted nucleic acid-binding protein
MAVLLLDNSAWGRFDSASLPPARREQIAEMMKNGTIAVCVPFLLEAGWYARNRSHHAELFADLLRLPRLRINEAVEDAALEAQRELGRQGHQRTAASSDLLIAACAHVHGAGVLHYDRHYDLLLELTELKFDSQWLAPPDVL